MSSLERFLTNHPSLNRDGSQELTRAVWGGVALEHDALQAHVKKISSQSQDAENLTEDILDELIMRTIGIDRIANETDAARIKLLYALYRREGQNSWATSHAIKAAYEYYFPKSSIYMLENAVESNLLVEGGFEAFEAGVKTELFGSWVPKRSLMASYEMENIPEIPDDPAGSLQTVYPFVNTTGMNVGGCTISIEGGKLKITLTATDWYVQMPAIANFTTATMRAKYTAPAGRTMRLYATGVNTSILKSQTTPGGYDFINGNNTLANNRLMLNCAFWQIGDIVYVDFTYIGTGAYLPGSLVDSSGNANNGTIFGATPNRKDGLVFDGVDDYLFTVATANQTENCVNLVLNRASLINAAGAPQMIFAWGTTAGGGWRLYAANNSPNCTLEFFRAGASENVSLVDILPIGKDINISVQYSVLTKVYTISKNGLVFKTGILTNTPIAPGSSTVFISKDYFISSFYFVGIIFNLRMYNRALSNEETLYLYQKNIQKALTYTEADYRMKDISEIPDAPAPDRTYLQDTWPTLDGWGTALDSVMSVDSGRLKIVYGGGDSQNTGFYHPISTWNGKTSRLKVTATIPITNMRVYTGVVFVSVPFYRIDDYTVIIDHVISTTHTHLFYRINNNGAGNPCEVYVDWVYIGTGAYLPNSFLDSSGNAKHGTIYGAIPDGKGGIVFDGISDYVLITSVPMSLNMTRVFSFVAPSWPTGTVTLFRHGSYNVNGEYYNYKNNGTIEIVRSISGGNYTTLFSYVFTAGTKYIIQIISTQTEIKLYVNGVLVQTLAPTVSTTIDSAPIYIGAYSATVQLFYGTISSPRIYNRALSEDEIELLYENMQLSNDELDDLYDNLDTDLPEVSVNMLEGFEGSKSVSLTTGGSIYQDVECTAGPHILTVPCRGSGIVDVTRLSDNKQWDFTTRSWVASASVSLVNAEDLYRINEYVVVMDAPGTMRVRFTNAVSSLFFKVDYLSLGLKPSYPFIRLLVSTFGQSGEFLNNWIPGADPVLGADYENATFLDVDYLGGEGGGSSNTYYQMILDYIKPAGVKALFEFIGRL